MWCLGERKHWQFWGERCGAGGSGWRRGVDERVGCRKVFGWGGWVEWCVVIFEKYENVIVKALEFEVRGGERRVRSKRTSKKQVEDEMKKNGLVKEDARDQQNSEAWRSQKPNEIQSWREKKRIKLISVAQPGGLRRLKPPLSTSPRKFNP